MALTRNALLGLASVLLFSFAAQAAAQEVAPPSPAITPPKLAPPTVEQELARTMFETAVEKSARGEWADSLELFARSRALVDRPVTALNQALVLARLSRLQEAIVVLDEASALARSPEDDELVQRIDQLRAEIAPLVGELTVSVEPSSAELTVDGVHRPAASSGTYTVPLDPGPHRVEAKRADYVPSAVELRLARGERRTLALILTRLPKSPIASPNRTRPNATVDSSRDSSSSSTSSARPLWRSARLWVPVGAVVAAAVTAAIVISVQGQGAGQKPDGGSSGRIFSPP